ncbi:DUF6612 family protein [Alteribacter keqinensis]|uniref:DUF4252 domain-containing protein n=1 Tax=Alteribacter keqinensis TaxID=2483800 RepID=A0A3M7TY63_9BACI|nr:DUF6612 family protein [Alteribacter keqinensis]RNA70516.1 hypothetical protein EBO34_11515 [Alteribacter keqinensis]
MKKVLLASCLSGVIILTAACSAESDDGLTAEEILLKSEEAMEELTSYSMSMKSTQEMSADGDTQEMDMESEIDVLMEPLTMFQTTTMDMMGISMNYDTYFSEEHGFFMEDPNAGGWFKLPDSFMEEMMALSDVQMSPEEQLQPFKDNIEELTVETEEDHYIVTLKGDGLDTDALKEQISSITGDGMSEMYGDALDSMDVHELEYELFIDRETFYNTEANIYMDTTVDDGMFELDLKQNIHILFTNFNGIDDLEVPGEVIENAEEVSEEDLFGGF